MTFKIFRCFILLWQCLEFAPLNSQLSAQKYEFAKSVLPAITGVIMLIQKLHMRIFKHFDFRYEGDMVLYFPTFLMCVDWSLLFIFYTEIFFLICKAPSIYKKCICIVKSGSLLWRQNRLFSSTSWTQNRS